MNQNLSSDNECFSLKISFDDASSFSFSSFAVSKHGRTTVGSTMWIASTYTPLLIIINFTYK